MNNRVTIRGCYSVRNENGWEIVETGKLMEKRGYNISVETNEDKLVMKGDDKLPDSIIQVGNQIVIELESNTYDKDDSFWLEKTNKPYTNNMRADAWMNMIRENSHVFDALPESSEEAVRSAEEAGVMIMDPPTSTLHGTRKLEFIIYLRGEETEKNFLMLAEQNIVPDDTGERKFRVEFTVYKCDFVTGSLEGNELEELEDILNVCVSGYGSKPEISNIRECLARIPQENFENIQVDLSVSELCEFNSWAEEM